jgi:IBR domain, a half RING-finger domain
VAKVSKPCPHCHSPVEKRGGCKHITCRCGYQFCYGCLAPWNLGHLATPCSAEHDHADVLRLGRRNDVLDQRLGADFAHLAAHRHHFEARGLPFVATEVAEGRQPRPQAAELDNRVNWTVRRAADRAGLIAPLRRALPLLVRGTVLLTGPQRLDPPRLDRLTRSQDLQVIQAIHTQAQALNTAASNQRSFISSAHLEPGLGGRSTQAFEEALLDAGLQRSNTAVQQLSRSHRGLPHVTFHDVIGGGQPYASPDTDMRSPARRYVHEGY